MDGLGEQGGASVLEQEPSGASLQRAVDVLVEVEGGDHDHGERILDSGPGEPPGCLDTVEVGHADVEQAHIGQQFTGERDGLQAVGSLSDDLDVGLGVENHGEAGPDDVLVVGDQHADGRGHDDRCAAWCEAFVGPPLGRVASTVQPPPEVGPARTSPPSREVRSVIPSSP
jgi:hypothetical protein